MFIGEEEVLEINTEAADVRAEVDSSWFGEYVRGGMDMGAILTVKEHEGAKGFSFQLNASNGGHTGQIDGNAVLESETEAVFITGSGCELTFN